MRKPKLREVLVVAPFLVWAGWDSFKDLKELEEHGGSMYVGKTTKFLYDVGGTWGVLIGIWGLVGLYLYAVWVTYKREARMREDTPPRTRSTQAPKMATPVARVTASPIPAPRPIAVAPPPFVPTLPSAEPTFLR